MTFQKVVLIIALILLILSLVIIGVLIKSAQTSAKFPPGTSKCHDFFKVGLGTCASGFTPVVGQDLDSRIQNCRLARGCGVTWDGITSATANQGNPYC